MPDVNVYYHDPVEVDPQSSWTGLCPALEHAKRIDIRQTRDKAIQELFDYARPDAVITIDGKPVVSIEQTRMNPSGHNIPQRFSCVVRAAELGIPSILYYPEYARRTFSDPNVRFLQVRVPLAQLRLIDIYRVPSLSIFWPTDPISNLPQTGRSAHLEMAKVIDKLIEKAGLGDKLLIIPEIAAAIDKMRAVVMKYAGDYAQNTSVRAIMPNGFASAVIPSPSKPTSQSALLERPSSYQTSSPISIDPPRKAIVYRTPDFVRDQKKDPTNPINLEPVGKLLLRRPYCLYFAGTANQSGNDSEHPWPGYLTLLDILYLRTQNGKGPTDRAGHLIYRLPIKSAVFIQRANQAVPPTATYIVDTFCDVIILEDGAILGRPLRLNRPAQLV